MRYNSYYNYRATGAFKAMVKDIVYRLRNFLITIFTGGRAKTILFYPEFPDWHADLHSIVFYSPYRITSNPREKFDYLINWEDATFKRPDATLVDLLKTYRAMNLEWTDIGKEKVEEVFVKVFGYSTFVDPFTYRGKAIEKSNLNSKHSSARFVDCPVSRVKEGFIYQKFLENKVDDKHALDVRLTWINGRLPIAMKRYKAQFDIFDKTLKYELAVPEKVFTPDEIDKILRFCREMKLDYAELDTIRNNEDNRLYIIDVNPAAHHPKSACSKADRKRKRAIVRENFFEQLKRFGKRKEPRGLHAQPS